MIDNLDDRPNTSLNRKRVIRKDEVNRNPPTSDSKSKADTESDKRENLAFAQRVSQSSHATFRAVNMTTGFNQQQVQKELGFSGTLARNHRTNLSSTDLGALTNHSWKPQTAGPSRVVSQHQFQQRPFMKSTPIPKNILYDKEVLYEQLIASKTANNHLSQDNNSLRTRITGLQEEMSRIAKKDQQQSQVLSNSFMDTQNPFETDKSKFKKLFSDHTMFTLAKSQQQAAPPQQQPAIVFSLKQQVSELKHSLSEKEKLLTKLMKTVKMTQFKEMEVELKLYSEECKRLRTMLEQHQKIEKDTRFKICEEERMNEKEGSQTITATTNTLNSAFTMLKSDNVEMAASLKRSEEEIFGMRVVIETMEKQLRSSKNECQQLRRQVYTKEREIESLKGGNDPSKGNSKKHPQFTIEGQLRMELEKKTVEITQLQAQILAKDKRVMDVEKRAREREADCQDKLTAEIKEKQDIQNLLDREKEVVHRLMHELDRSDAMTGRHGTSSVVGSMRVIAETGGEDVPISRATQRKLTLARSQQTSSGNIGFSSAMTAGGATNRSSVNSGTATFLLHAEHPFANINRKLLPRITLEEVKPLAEDLKYRLKVNRISLSELENLLFNENSEEITLQDVYDVLNDSPCNLGEGSIAMARYLVEDNTLDKIQFDGNASNFVPFVRSALRNLLDAYTLFPLDQEPAVLAHIAAVLAKQRGMIEDLLVRDPTSQKVKGVLCCSKTQLIGMMDSADIKLSQSELELLFVHLFAESQTVSAIPVESIYRIFSVDRFQQQIHEHPQSQPVSNQKLNQLDSDEVETKTKKSKNTQQTQPMLSSFSRNDNHNNQQQNQNQNQQVVNNANNHIIINDMHSRSSGLNESSQVDVGNENNGEEIMNAEENSLSQNNEQPDEHDDQVDNQLFVNQGTLAEQTNYTQQTHSQFRRDSNDPFHNDEDFEVEEFD